MEDSLIEDIRERFYLLKTRQDVAEMLGIKDKSLRYFLFKRRPENMYQSFQISKKNGGFRKISAPGKKLKAIQNKLALVLRCVYEPKVCAFGFIDNKDFIGNAAKHVKRNLILNIDLKDFFGQIHFGRIQGMFMKPPYSIGKEAATTIAQIACYKGVLPQGSPSSPILTNMICAPLDNNLMRFAKTINCTYTRYADDISFSTYKKTFDVSLAYMENETVHLGEKFLTILKRHSFTINPEKIALRSRYDRQEVTGLTVNAFPNPRRSYIKQLRAILHHCEKDGLYVTAQEYIAKGYCNKVSIKEIVDDPEKTEVIESWFRQVLIGKILYIRQVKGKDDLTYLSLAQKLNSIMCETVLDIDALNILEYLIANNTFILEYSQGDEYTQGSGFYLETLGILTSFHVTQNDCFFKIFSHVTYPKEAKGIIGKSLNEILSDETIDYALYKPPCSIENTSLFKIGDSTKLRIGDKVTTAGYPNHQAGNSPYIQTCSITSKKDFHGARFYTISGRIVHGASGGVVLNEKQEVIGIIKGGIVTMDEDDSNENQGFIPIHLVVEHLREQSILVPPEQ